MSDRRVLYKSGCYQVVADVEWSGARVRVTARDGLTDEWSDTLCVRLASLAIPPRWSRPWTLLLFDETGGWPVRSNHTLAGAVSDCMAAIHKARERRRSERERIAAAHRTLDAHQEVTTIVGDLDREFAP